MDRIITTYVDLHTQYTNTPTVLSKLTMAVVQRQPDNNIKKLLFLFVDPSRNFTSTLLNKYNDKFVFKLANDYYYVLSKPDAKCWYTDLDSYKFKEPFWLYAFNKLDEPPV